MSYIGRVTDPVAHDFEWERAGQAAVLAIKAGIKLHPDRKLRLRHRSTNDEQVG